MQASVIIWGFAIDLWNESPPGMMTQMHRYDPTKRATACPPVGRVPGAMQRDLDRLLGPAFQVIP